MVSTLRTRAAWHDGPAWPRCAMLAALLLAPALALAGCAAAPKLPVPPLVQFAAVYERASDHARAQVTLSEAEYLAADGAPEPGYVLDVTFPAEVAITSGRPQTVFDGAFTPVRHRWCNGWHDENGVHVCDTDEYDWSKDGRPVDDPDLRVGALRWDAVNATPMAAGGWQVRGEFATAEFADATLAPTRVLSEQGALLWSRLEYRETRPLRAVPAWQASSLEGQSLAGALPQGWDQPVWGQNVSLAQALAYARDRDAEANRLLQAPCLTSLSITTHAQSARTLPVYLSNDTLAELDFTLQGGATATSFALTWGQSAPLGQPAFLGMKKHAANLAAAAGQTCLGSSQPTLATVLERAARFGSREPHMVYGIVQANGHLLLGLQRSGADLHLDATTGFPKYLWLPAGSPFDPGEKNVPHD